MPSHLTDIACLEWVRSRKTTLAPETPSAVATHLEHCVECRAKLDDFAALERSFHPYGGPMPEPAGLRAGRAVKAFAIVTGVVAAIAAVVALMR